MRIGRTRDVIVAEPLVHPVPAAPEDATPPREGRPSRHPGDRAVSAGSAEPEAAPAPAPDPVAPARR